MFWNSLKTIGYILFGLFIGFNSMAQENAKCKCKNNFKEVFISTDKDQNRMLVCGQLEKRISASKYLLKQISVYDCTNEELILNYDYDHIYEYELTNYSDSIIMVYNIFLPVGSDWKMTRVPKKAWRLEFLNDTAQINRSNLAFKYPHKLSKMQQDSVEAICSILVKKMELPKTHYPLQYETLFILLVGALDGNNAARDIFNALETHFRFDGAAAETLAEVKAYNVLNKP